MGIAFKDQGSVEEAMEAFNKAIKLKPNSSEAHRNLSALKQYTVEDEQFLQVKELYERLDLSEADRYRLNFALAKMYDDIGDLDKAFKHLSQGNKLRKKLLNYSIEQDKDLFTKLKKNTASFIRKYHFSLKQSSNDLSPIFILGMPRSGTTLVEQIISSHSKIMALGN